MSKKRFRSLFNLFIVVSMLLMTISPALAASPKAAVEPNAPITLLEEGFEDTFPPSGWSLYQSSGDPWEQTSSRVHSGSYSAYHNDTFSDNESWIVSSQISLPSDTLGITLSFWENQNYDSYYVLHEVRLSTGSGNPVDGDFTELLYDGVGTEDTWQEISLDISAYAGQDVYIAWYYEGYFADEWYIDDVLVWAEGPSVFLTPETQSGAACQNFDAIYELTVINDTGAADTFDLTAMSEWPVGLSDSSVTLNDGESTTVDVTVSVPHYAYTGSSDVATIEATGTSYSAEATLETFAGNLWLPAEAGGLETVWPAFATDGSAFYYFDGMNGIGAAINGLQVYDPATGWNYVGSVQPAANYGGVAGYNASDGLIYYAPGFEDGWVASEGFGYFDPSDDSSGPLASMPEALGLGAGGVTDADEFVWVGGSPDLGFLDYTPVYVYDISTDTWITQTALMDVGFTAPGYVMVGDQLYVGGSYFQSKAFYVYDVGDDTWTQLADLPGAAAVSPLMVYDGMDIYLIGGGTTPATPTDEVWRYDIGTDTWSEFVPLNTATLGNAGGYLGGALYTFGGGDASGANPVAPHEYTLPQCPLQTTADLTGNVTNGVSGEPIEGAMVVAEGTSVLTHQINSVVPMAYTDANGDYALSLPAEAMYDVTVSFGDFDAKTESVAVTLVGPNEQDFVLGPAVASASPDNFNVQLFWDTTATSNFDIGNAGYSVMDFALVENNGGKPIEMVQLGALNSDRKLGSLSKDPSLTPLADVKQPHNWVQVDSLLDDSGFEYGPPPASSWTEVTDNACEWIIDPSGVWGIPAYAGVYTYWAGGYCGGVPSTDYVEQSVTLNGSCQVSFAANYYTLEADDDILYISIDGTYVWENPLSPDDHTDFAWVTEGPIPLGTFSGETVDFRIGIDSFGDLTGNVLVDEIALECGGGGGVDIPWLSEDPITGTVDSMDMASYADVEIELNFDATIDYVDALGTYTGTLTLATDDPANPMVEMPVTMEVVANPDASLLEGTVTSDRPGGAVEGAEVFIESHTTTYSATLMTDENGYYSQMLRVADVGAYTVTVTAADYFVDEQVVDVSAPGPVVHDVELIYDGPEMLVDPTYFEKSLVWGQSTTDMFTITNQSSLVDLNYLVAIEPAADEGFESGIPAGWTVIDNEGTGVVWDTCSNWGDGNYTGGEGDCVMVNSDAAGSVEYDTELWLPIDLTGYSYPQLSYLANFQSYIGLEYLDVDVSPDGGDIWYNLLSWNTDHGGFYSTPGEQVNIDLSAFAGMPVVLRWHYYDPAGGDWDWYAQVDEIVVTEGAPTITYFSEDFEDTFPPTGWNVVVNGTVGGEWNTNTYWGAPNRTGGSGQSADADADAFTQGMDTELWSPPIDLTGIAHPLLTYESNFQDYLGGGDALLDISTDGGTTWTNLTWWTEDHGPTSETVDLTAYSGETVMLRWWYYTPGWDWYWQIDDVQIVEVLEPNFWYWLGWNPYEGLITTDSSEVVTVTIDSTPVAGPGIYEAGLVVSGDDPFNPADTVGLMLHVLDHPDQGYVSGTVYASRSADGDNMPLAGAYLDFIGLSGTFTTTVVTDENGEYELYLPPWVLPQTFQINAYMGDYLPNIGFLAIGKGDQQVYDVTLRLWSSNLSVDPESINETLAWGGSTALSMTVSNPNPATGALTTTLMEVSSAFEPLYPEVVTVQVPAYQPANLVESEGIASLTTDSQRPLRDHEIIINNLALGKIKVLIVSAEVGWGNPIDGLDSLLAAYPDLQVDVFPMEDVPTLDDLLPYNVVFVGNNNNWPIDIVALGDVMADYVDAGGSVMLAQASMYLREGVDFQLDGRFRDEGYSPLVYTDLLASPGYLGVYNGAHPVMDNILWIDDYSVHGVGHTLTPGAEVVAYYTDGEIYLASKGSVFAINQLLTGGNDWDGDVPTLLHNIILFLAGGDIPWLDSTETFFNLPVGHSEDTTISLDASVVEQPGTYTAWLWFDNNDILQPGAYVPVEMVVEPDPDMARLEGTVTMNRHEDGEGIPAAGATVVISTTMGTTNLRTNPDGQYVYYYGPSGLPMDATVSASYPGYQDDEGMASLSSGATSTVDLEVEMMAPWIHMGQHEFDVTLNSDLTTTLQLDISNLGLMDLEIPLIQEISGTVSGLASTVYATNWVDTAFSIDAQVSQDLASAGTADMFIWLRERADLSPAYQINDKNLRHSFVYEALSSVANSSQAGIIQYLESRGFDYTSFWINNSILVHNGDQALVDAMQARGDVVRVRGVYVQAFEPDPDLVAVVAPSDAATNADPTWNIDIVNAPAVWEQLGVTGQGAVVANIDTGVRYSHEALVDSYRGNLGGGVFDHNYNWGSLYGDGPTACADSDLAPCDWAGHGSHTMGTMVGGDGLGPFDMDIGMAPDAEWIACMGCDIVPNGCSDEALTGCAEWMVAPLDLNGENPDPSKAPDVINNSWGGGGEDDWYYSFVEAWHASNIIPVFSAGNDGPSCDTLGSPGSYDNVLGVGGTDNADNNYTYTSRGPGSGTGVFPVQKPDVAAPGEAVPSSINTGDASYGVYSGTSMAAPHVSGLVALLRSVDSTISFDEIWAILTTNTVTDLTLKNGTWCGTGPDFPNYVFGYGRIDAFASVLEAQSSNDIPWLELSAYDGVIAPMPPVATDNYTGTMSVELTIDTTGLLPGDYYGTLRVLHNDPLTGQVLIPIHLNVPGTYELYLPIIMR